jgi:hypothetical protein
VVSGFQKRLHLPESVKNSPQNAASAATVQVGGSQKELANMKKVEVQRPGRYYYGKKAIEVPSMANSRCRCQLSPAGSVIEIAPAGGGLRTAADSVIGAS